MTFEYGFAINGIFYGWHEKQLYRLPSKIGNRYYGFRQVKPIKVGNKIGYRVNRQTKSIDQLRGITISFLSPIKIQTNEHIA
jgi:hypothetical protein